jgi:hypothetical protein
MASTPRAHRAGNEYMVTPPMHRFCARTPTHLVTVLLRLKTFDATDRYIQRRVAVSNGDSV